MYYTTRVLSLTPSPLLPLHANDVFHLPHDIHHFSFLWPYPISIISQRPSRPPRENTASAARSSRIQLGIVGWGFPLLSGRTPWVDLSFSISYR